MQFSIPQAKGLSLAAGIAMAIVVAACSGNSQGGSGTSLTAGGGSPAGGGATISVAAPGNGAQVSVPFNVQLDASVPLGPPESGNHHAHLYFDTDTGAADYDIVYGNSWQVTRSLAPGKHTIIATLANPGHSLAGPTQTITVTVAGAGSGGGSGQPPASSGQAPGY